MHDNSVAKSDLHKSVETFLYTIFLRVHGCAEIIKYTFDLSSRNVIFFRFPGSNDTRV